MRKIILFFSFIIGCSKTPTDVPIDSQNDVESIVTFSVDMSIQIAAGNFNESLDFLDIAGSFNNWEGGSEYYLLESENDIYEISFTSFSIGEIIEYKYRIVTSSGINWESLIIDDCTNCIEDEDGYVNRTYIIQVGQNNVSCWYNEQENN